MNVHRLTLVTLVAFIVSSGSTATATTADVWSTFVEWAAAEHGERGRVSAEFLAAHRPAGDAEIPLELLTENLAYALTARDEFPWAAAIPDEIFLNDVRPYAPLDEMRESWRPDFYEKARALVADCTTATEAVQTLNREFFNLVHVHYNTGRKRPNQSPSESIAQGRATCTGLSIILVDACRAVGVPARVAGTALWTNKRGNHTWVEIWDGEWAFTGADEYNKKGLNRGWFKGSASKAKAGEWIHAIWASSWKPTGDVFPLVWNIESRDVPGVNVTHRYVAGAEAPASALGVWYLRVHDVANGERLVAEVDLIASDGLVSQSVTTRAGRADLNDMPDMRVAPGIQRVLRVRHEGVERTWVGALANASEATLDLVWNELSDEPVAVALTRAWLASGRAGAAPNVDLDAAAAASVAESLTSARADEIRRDRVAEHEAQTVSAGDTTMKYKRRVFGDAPFGERSLWISMHGGGGAPAEVNDQQWNNQIGLYEPAEGFYVAPRAPTDTWNLWHRGHIDALFDRLIENHVAFDGVDPNRVYLMGYSAGGDGVYQLAPRMADRFAAASMMAGHPNDASPLGLRNLPFAIFMGGDDASYNRNKVAANWGKQLDELAASDPGGYPHRVDIFEGLGHWMDRRDAVAVPWMAEHTRAAWPRRVVWHQSARTHDRFAWLAVPPQSGRKGQTITAQVDGQSIVVTTEKDLGQLTLRLCDDLLNLDEPIRVTIDGATVFEGVVKRRVAAIDASLTGRFDPHTVATAELTVELVPQEADSTK